MIKMTSIRENNGTHTLSRTVPVGDAILSAIVYELGFGGRIVEFTDAKLSVETRVLAALDTVVFEGSVEEMHPLLEAVAVFGTIAKLGADKDIASAFERHGDENGKVRALVAVHFLPIAIGHNRAVKTLICLLAETEEDVSLFSKVKSDDITTLVKLKYNDNVSQGDLRSLAT